LLVRFTLDRSYFLSRLSAATPSFCLHRVPSSFPPDHPATRSRFGLRFLRAVPCRAVPFASFSNLRRQCCSERGGPEPETRGAAMLTRSDRSLDSPRFASLRFASSSSATRRGRDAEPKLERPVQSCPPPLLPPYRSTPRHCC